MINTPEFWVGVSFLMCLGLSYKLIVPILKSTLIQQQADIERSFSNAENILQTAEKKFSLMQERLHLLPTLMGQMEADFDAKINHQIHEWNVQKEKTVTQYQSLQNYKLQHLTDHTKSQLYSAVTGACLNLLNGYFQQQMTAKKHQLMVKDAVKYLSKA